MQQRAWARFYLSLPGELQRLRSVGLAVLKLEKRICVKDVDFFFHTALLLRSDTKAIRGHLGLSI